MKITACFQGLLLLTTAACASQAQSFRPTTGGAQGRGGELAAAYDVRDDGGRIAQVNVWSQGAYVSNDGRATVVHAAIEVQNVSAQPLTLDTGALALEAFDAGGAPVGPPRLWLVEPAGPVQRPVAPSTAVDFDVLFTLDPGIAPDRIGSLRLRWTLLHTDGRQYVQFTDFGHDDTRIGGGVYAYVPVYGFYDPFWFWPPYRLAIGHHTPIRHVWVVPSHHRWHR